MHYLQRLINQSKGIEFSDIDGDLCMPYVISTKQKSTNTCQTPKCAACILGKMEHVPTSTTQSPGYQSGEIRRD